MLGARFQQLARKKNPDVRGFCLRTPDPGVPRHACLHHELVAIGSTLVGLSHPALRDADKFLDLDVAACDNNVVCFWVTAARTV